MTGGGPVGAGGQTSTLQVLRAVALPVFIAAADQTTTAAVQPLVARELGNADLVSWIMVSYLFAITVAVPIIGRASDMFGKRRLMFASLALSISGALLCMMAQSMETLILARMVQGVGGGGCMALAQGLVGEQVPAREHGRFQSYIAAILVIASASGPVIGGLMAGHFGWRSLFLTNLLLGLVAIWLLRGIEGRPGTGASSEPYDFIGLAWFVTTVTVLFGIIFRLQEGDLNPAVLAGAALLALLLVSMLVRRERSTPNPFIPLDLLSASAMARINAVAMLHGAALTALVTILPLYLSAVRGISVAGIGLLLLPVTIAVGVGSIATGHAISRFGRRAVYPAAGLLATGLLLALTAALEPGLGANGLIAILTLAGLCMGTVMVFVQTSVLAEAEARTIGVAAAFVQFSRSLGAAFGAALAGLFSAVSLTDGAASSYDVGHFSIMFRLSLLTIAAFAVTGSLLLATATGRGGNSAQG